MSATNFWNNFKNGFLNGMFFNTPLFNCFNGFGGFNSVFCGWNNGLMSFGSSSPSLFFTPYFDIGSSYPPIPQANFNFDTSKIFDNVNWNNTNWNSVNWDTVQFSNNFITPSNNFTQPVNWGDTFSKSTLSNSKSSTPTSTLSSANDSKYKPDPKLGKWNTRYDSLITKYAQKYNVDAKLVKALMKQESQFNPNAKSQVGAIGLMQLMPNTAKEMGANDPYNVEQNIEAGVKYLKKMLDRFHGNIELAIAAYNAGPGNIKNGKIPQNGETPKHVRAVMANYRALA